MKSLDILSAAERHFLLEELNHTTVTWPTSQPVQVLFEQQAAQNPAALALTFEGKPSVMANLTAGQTGWRMRCWPEASGRMVWWLSAPHAARS